MSTLTRSASSSSSSSSSSFSYLTSGYEVMQDTIKILDDGGYDYKSPDLADKADKADNQDQPAASKRVTLPPFSSIAVYFENAQQLPYPPREDADAKPTVYMVENKDTLTMTTDLLAAGYKRPAFLILASYFIFGGGYLEGAAAQEESLFRRTDLHRYAPQCAPKYPLPPSATGSTVVYFPDVVIFRDESTALMPEPVVVSAIASAAIDGPILNNIGRLNPTQIATTMNAVRGIIRVAAAKGHDAVVLGALGCGAYRNPPEDIASSFRKVLVEEQLGRAVPCLAFAIAKSHRNLSTFERHFRSQL